MSLAAFLRRSHSPSWTHLHFLRRTFASSAASAASAAALLDLTHPTYVIWGANTDVGKTLVSTGLAAAALRTPSSFLYIKPIQTGFPHDSDSRYVLRRAAAFSPRSRVLTASHHLLYASFAAAGDLQGAIFDPEMESRNSNALNYYEEERIIGRSEEELSEGSLLVCKTLYAWKEPVSPHLAAEREGMAVGDAEIRETLRRSLMFGLGDTHNEVVWKIIETAGGVASPGPSGTLQCDLYRPFRLPAVLVGDGRLGGISATISAYESLKLRGYDVVAVILMDHGLSNEVALLSYLRKGTRVLLLPQVPQDMSNDLTNWFQNSSEVFSSLQEMMQSAHLERLDRLHSMPKKACDVFWWPFTQHDLVPKERVMLIDSRFGENFAIHKMHDNQETIVSQFDACASWWTQGPDAALQIEIARDMAYSAARFGHVMFPENVYEPALKCSELLLEGVGKGWASRTFFSDNGSTAIEIALKMAFRKFAFDFGIYQPNRKDISVDGNNDFRVLALNGSYHGDTLGAMEAQAPSPYTGFLQQPWYSGKGLFLDPPTTSLGDNFWSISLPNIMLSDKSGHENMRFSSCEELFCQSREFTPLARTYLAYISGQLSQYSELERGIHIAALIMEPVIQGAGGMHMIDPLFQRILVKECKDRKIPVIFDEVFTGFWRLGRESAAELLCCFPDISCFGKLMTGGVIPLAVTLTTEEVFRAFKGVSKLKALLHGHSYSAHATGCTTATKAIQWFKDRSTNPNINIEGKKLNELWDMQLVCQMSSLPSVQRVVAIGTLCAIELKATGADAGYASQSANSLVHQLREDGIYIRPLGNVIYLMCGPCTSPDVCSMHLEKVYRRIQEFSQKQATGTEFCHA